MWRRTCLFMAQEMTRMANSAIATEQERQQAASTLELSELQSGILHPRPSPYVGTYIVFRVDDRRDGREFLKRLERVVASAADWSASASGWLTVAISYQGLRALGVPQASLDSFPPEFREGMAARAEDLGDIGESAPENWEQPLGSSDVHMTLAAIAPDAGRLAVIHEGIADGRRDLEGVTEIWRQECYALPTEREAFGFKDGISHPAIEGSGIPGSN